MAYAVDFALARTPEDVLRGVPPRPWRGRGVSELDGVVRSVADRLHAGPEQCRN
ncbi:hypothetical protein [Desulfuromonas sp.]|uniref:hypothetical protein n=1 Tax=Desulfuromonas sp. TaxID=892 RepID=UPI0025B7D452|nr:hypothetical protein [Desulfuromonas sp.]